ncbi:MAG: TonB-dependent receptor, partial [Bacteroidales bacterium]|nr:TonB-dependent receptor [Bacteroidales bacterium]
MKKLLLIVFFWGACYLAFAQTQDRVVLANVGLDSLKRVVEQNTEYKLFYVIPKDEPPVRLTVSWDRGDFFINLSSALGRVGYTLSQMNDYLYVLKGTGIMTRLPDRYFSSTEQRQDTLRYITALTSSQNLEAGSANKIYTIGDPNAVFTGNRAMLSGYIKSSESREPAMSVLVTVLSTGVNAVTDVNGYYRIAVPVGKVDLELKGYGLEDTPVMLEVFANGTLDILMNERVYSLRSAVVSAEANQNRRSTFVGLETISVSRIRHIPTVFGEADLVKVMLALPGVKTVGESSGGFNVRGGATDQNLILFNGGTLYNPTHLFGLFSSFNPDVVSDIELYKSSIPAKYGGRISSVLDVNSRQGNSQKITGSAGIGLLTGKLHLEGPIVKERTHFIVGARTTYSNWILNMLPQKSGYRNGTANFYDLTAGVTHKVNESNSCSLHAYYSADRFSFSKDTTYSYSNMNFAFKWRSAFTSRHTMNLTTGYDAYQHNLEEVADPVRAYNMRFDLEQYFAKINFDLLIGDRHSLSYGVNGVLYDLSPGSFLPQGSQSLITPDRVANQRGVEAALFVSDKWDISDKFAVDIGVRYGLYSALGPAEYYLYRDGQSRSKETVVDSVQVGKGDFVKPYHGPEFRLSARYLVNDGLTIKAGVNTMRQNIHMLSNTVSASPIDIWKLSDAHIVPQTGWQAAAGFYQNLFDDQWELSVEGYYKAIDHYLDYKTGAVLNMN